MKKRLLFTILMISLFLGLLHSQDVTSSGTGFFVSANGTIVTCAHVIEDADKITVKIGETEYPAEILIKNAETDLAILSINYRNQHHFGLTNFDIINLGDKAFVLGFPLSDILGSDIRLTDGIVSARSGINADQTYFQISAPIQPGNSGGPIFNENFEVIGVAAHKLHDMATLASSGVIPQNINFGVKSDFIVSLYRNLPLGGGNITSMNEATRAVVQILSYESNERRGSSIHIANRTGYVIYYVYISPATSTSWGTDRLGSSVLINGQNLSINSLDLSSNNLYDIMLIDEDNDTYTMRNISLSPNQTIEFTLSDIDRGTATNYSSMTNSFITIENRTGYTVWYLYVSPTSSTSWGADLLGDDVLLSGHSIRVPLPQNQNNQFDIRLIDNEADTYTKSNIRIMPNQRIEFTLRDLD